MSFSSFKDMSWGGGSTHKYQVIVSYHGSIVKKLPAQQKLPFTTTCNREGDQWWDTKIKKKQKRLSNFNETIIYVGVTWPLFCCFFLHPDVNYLSDTTCLSVPQTLTSP